MEAAGAAVSFVSLAGPVAQGLKFLYDFTTDMKECPKEIREMRTDIDLVEDLITEVIQQCNGRDRRLRESAALARAIHHARESVRDLGEELDKYRVDGKRQRFKFAVRLNQTQKLRASLNRTKTNMFEFKTQLQSDLSYDIHDTGLEILREVEKTNRTLETYNQTFHKVIQKSEAQAETTKKSGGRVEASAQLASDASSEGLADITVITKKLDHITDLLTETRISSSQNSSPSTPALSREASDSSVVSSSQETTASSISSLQSTPQSVFQNAREANIALEHPLLRFKDNTFQFLVAIIFTQRASKRLACQCASECLAAYPTPEALSEASPGALQQYLSGIGLHNKKPLQLINLARAYVKDPPQRGRLRSKANCPQSEVSHLPQIGLQSINAWLVYCCERTDVVTNEKPLLDYMEYLKTHAGANRL